MQALLSTVALVACSHVDDRVKWASKLLHEAVGVLELGLGVDTTAFVNIY